MVEHQSDILLFIAYAKKLNRKMTLHDPVEQFSLERVASLSLRTSFMKLSYSCVDPFTEHECDAYLALFIDSHF